MKTISLEMMEEIGELENKHWDSAHAKNEIVINLCPHYNMKRQWNNGKIDYFFVTMSWYIKLSLTDMANASNTFKW